MSAGVIAALGAALPAGWRLRVEDSADLEFLGVLYAETRSAELAAAAWDALSQATFLREQFELQHAHYLKHYGGAHFLVLEHAGALSGRLYVHEGATELRLMDIALIASQRGKGVGGALIAALQAYAQRCQKALTLHVEPNNPVQRLYARMGFRLIEQRGPYDFLGWRSP